MRRADTAQTSAEALASVNLPASRAAALDAVRAWPGRTALQLEQLTGCRSLRPRLLELEAQGLVVRTEATVVDGSTGRRAHTWVEAEEPVLPLGRPRRKPREVQLLERELEVMRERLEAALVELREASAEVLRLTAEHREAADALGRGWMADGVPLAVGIGRKVRALLGARDGR